jgi:hypothetical protein
MGSCFSQTGSDKEVHAVTQVGNVIEIQAAPTLTTLEAELERINEVDFDVFNYFRLVGSREDAFELGMRRMVEPFYS